MGYQVSVTSGDTEVKCLVLDFSASGIQIEVRASSSIPQEGRLVFRDQAFCYFVKYESATGNTRRLGLETTAIPDEKPLMKDRSATESFEESRSSRERSFLNAGNWSVAIWIVGLAGLSATCLFMFGQKAVSNRQDQDAFWSKLASAAQYVPTTKSENGHVETRPSKPEPNHRSIDPQRYNTTSLEPHSSLTDLIQRASEFLATANYEAIIAMCDRAIADNDSTATLWHLRGIAQSKLARFDQAIDDLRNAVALNASDLLIQVDLSQTLCDAGQIQEGLDQLLVSLEKADADLPNRLRQTIANYFQSRSSERRRKGFKAAAESDRQEAAVWNDPESFPDGLKRILLGTFSPREQPKQLKQFIAEVFETRSAERRQSGDEAGAKMDEAEAARWNR